MNPRLLILLASSVFSLGGCATQNAGLPPSTYAVANDPAPIAAPVARTAAPERVSMTSARAAFESGNLAEAELQFAALARRDAGDSRAIYNLAMVRLQLAYDGLERYRQLEPDAPGGVAAKRMLRLLASVAAPGATSR